MNVCTTIQVADGFVVVSWDRDARGRYCRVHSSSLPEAAAEQRARQLNRRRRASRRLTVRDRGGDPVLHFTR